MSSQETQPVATATPTPLTLPDVPSRNGLWPAIGLRYHLAVLLTLGTIVLLAYANSFNTGFPLDNKFIILEDPRLRGVKQDNIRLIFTQDYWWPKAVSGLYRPLTTLSYWFDYTVLGNADQPAGYHWVNFFLHWTNSCLVYFLVLVLVGNAWAAFFTAAIFGTHPLATESVTNIIGRADLFAGVAVLGGFLFYAKSTTRTGWRKLPWLLGLMLITTFGVFAKENSVVVLGVIVLYDLLFRVQPLRRNWFLNLVANFWRFLLQGYVALIPPFAALWWVRSHVFEKLRPPELPWVDNPLTYINNPLFKTTTLLDWIATSRMTAVKVIGKYFWLLLWPQTMSCDYSYNQVPIVNWNFSSWEFWKAMIALVALLAVILVAVRHWRRNKPVAFFILFFLGTLLPTANLLKIIGSIMAERFLYLPLIGYAGCLVMTVYALCRHYLPQMEISEWALRIWLQVLARSILTLLAVGYGTRAFFRNFDWESDVTLWTSAVQACPDSFKTHKSLAFALYEQDTKGDNIDPIILEGEKALAVTDQTQIVLLHLGAYYRIKGDKLAQHAPDGTLISTPLSLPWYRKSVEVLQKAVPLDHAFNDDNRQKELARGRSAASIQDIGNHEIYWNLGLSCMRLSQYQQALEAYRYMQHLAPTNPDAYLSIASVYLATGKLEDAAISLLQTLLLDNSRQETLRLLVDLYRQIDRQGCAVVFNQGQPKLNVDCQIVRANMCAAYFNLVQTFLDSKQYTLAQQTKANALQNYKCAPEQFEQLLPTTPAPTPAP